MFRMFSMFRTIRIAALPLLLLPLASPLGAQGFPSRPIKVVVPYAAGGNMEHWRPTLEQVGQVVGQQLIVENRPGAGGATGSDFVAKSPPDGYTLVIGTMGSHAINQSVYSKLPYDGVKDFTPIVFIATMANVAAVNAELPVATMQAFIDHARANPGKLNFASPGNGSSAHLTGELFKQITGTSMQHVPYKGSAPAITDLVAGRVHIVFDNLPLPLAHIRAGRLRALAVTSSQRSPMLPDTPTLAEAGVPGIDVSPWYGIFGPAGMPTDVTMKINAAFNDALRVPRIRDQLTTQGWTLFGGPPEELAVRTQADVERWSNVAKTANVKVD